MDVVSDGEMGKPSYVTYITDRLDGFGGDSQPLDLLRTSTTFPDAAEEGVRRPRPLAAQDARRATAPITVKDPEAARPTSST